MQQQDERWDGWATLGGLVVFGMIVGIGMAIDIQQSTITLIAGTVVGIGVATPAVAVITWLLVHRHDAPKSQPPAPVVQQTRVVEQHLHIHLGPGQTMPANRGEMLALLTQRTGSIEQARALMAAGRVTVVEGEVVRR